ncbi:MAG: SAM-dependent chlorinase/fluorinase [Ectothiorhodospiraceae bacterium]|nr:SAM-dependent chlorinase/fluorinase [Ectothiorhodospiraceae bacterium]
MIVLFTDYGWQGPYVGQMKAACLQVAPTVPIIDLLHDAPVFDAHSSAYLLAAYASSFPEGTIFLGVVDPGVGSDSRQPVMLHVDGRWFVGPDNGLFDIVFQQGNASEWWNITWQPQSLSRTFHGRDLFAPVAAKLAMGEVPPGITMPFSENQKHPVFSAALDYYRVIYIDPFGNAITGLRASAFTGKRKLQIGKHRLNQAQTFSDVAVGDAFWYENANGLVEIAINQGSAAKVLEISVGDTIGE